jgi:hypothetical protein
VTPVMVIAAAAAPHRSLMVRRARMADFPDVSRSDKNRPVGFVNVTRD